MVATFACPDCGSLLALKGHAAGLRVRCGDCGTLVEVPFLPRARSSSRGRGQKLGWMIAGGGTITAVIMVIVAVVTARDRGQATRLENMHSHIVMAEASADQGDWDVALRESAAAMKIADRLGPCEEVASTRAIRDRVVLQAMTAELSAAEESAASAQIFRDLRDRIHKDPALSPLSDRAQNDYATALELSAQTDLEAASRAFAAGDAMRSLSLCERVAKIAQELGFARASSLKESANAIVDSMVAQVGVVLSPVRGSFLDEASAASGYSAALHPMLTDALKGRGYLPRPRDTAFASSWDRPLPYQLSIEVDERYAGVFFQSPLRTYHLNGHAELMTGTRAIWQARFQGATRVPPPGMSAFESSRLSLAKQREPEAEKRLYEDALKVLAENLALSLGKIPWPVALDDQESR